VDLYITAFQLELSDALFFQEPYEFFDLFLIHRLRWDRFSNPRECEPDAGELRAIPGPGQDSPIKSL
jgi:hypothetical protein